MTKILFHPRHVDDALVSFEAADEAVRLARCEVVDVKSPDYLPPEALVRLLRRCRSDPSPRVQRGASVALVRFVGSWVARRYAGLFHADRQEMAQKLLLHVSEKVAARGDIDWWEITFHRNLERAAADFYPELFDLPRDAGRVDVQTQDQAIHDEGEQAGELVAETVRRARLAEILQPGEVQLFWLLFMSPVPLRSAKATVDLVRLLGKPEGTLREMKTAIRKKLEAAAKDGEL